MKNWMIFLLITFNWLTTFSQVKSSGELMVKTDTANFKINILAPSEKVKTNTELTYAWYKANKLGFTKGDYDGVPLHGKFVVYSLNDEMLLKGNYKKGLKDGEWIEWYNSEQIESVVNYKSGLKSGSEKEYDFKGVLLREKNYKNGILHGEQHFYSNGNKVSTEKYKNGEKIVE